MKTIRVVAAVIRKGNRIFATQRGYGEFKDGWEFPGGKIEPGETPQEALVREIREELETEIRVGDLIDTIEYDYPAFHLSMDCFWCEIVGGSLELKEHEAAKWLDRESLYTVDWLPADVGLVEKIRKGIDEKVFDNYKIEDEPLRTGAIPWTGLSIPKEFELKGEGQLTVNGAQTAYQTYGDGLVSFRVYRGPRANVLYPALNDGALTVLRKVSGNVEYAVVGEIPLKLADHVISNI